LKFSSANPASAEERFHLAGARVDELKAAYENADGGQGKADAANKLLDALDTYKQLGMEAFQRPSDAWQQVYDQITAEIMHVQGDAKSVTDTQTELQKKLLEAQNQANAYAGMTASATAASSADLDSLDSEARGYYTWAQQHGTALYEQQRVAYQQQLTAITGGTDVELFIAAKQREAVDELKEIRRLISQWATGPGAASPGASGDTPGGSTTAPGGGDEGTSGTDLTPKAGRYVTASEVMGIVTSGARQLKKAMANV
jgi:hypothetical protein